MNNIHDQPKWNHKENWEKLTMILLSLVGYLEFSALVIYAILIDSDLTKLILNLYFVLVILAITGLLLRKGMKYSISAKGVSIGYGTELPKEKPEPAVYTPEPVPPSNLRGEE